MDAYWDFLSGFSSEKDSNLQKAQTYSLASLQRRLYHEHVFRQDNHRILHNQRENRNSVLSYHSSLPAYPCKLL